MESTEETDPSGNAVITSLADKYMNFTGEAIVINSIGGCMVGLAIILPCFVRCQGFREGRQGREGANDARL